MSRDYEIEHEGRYHRLQVDGGDLVSVEDQGDGTAFVTVYSGSDELGEVAWAGVVSVETYPTSANQPLGS